MVENPSAQCQVAVSADGRVTWKQEEFIIKTPWASHAPLDQCLSSAETSSQLAPGLHAKDLLYLLMMVVSAFFAVLSYVLAPVGRSIPS